MKIFWLTPTQFLTGLILGTLIGLISVAVMVPHPVEVPIQVITPVPTPPPVVITQVPAPTNFNNLEIAQFQLADQTLAAIQMCFALVPIFMVIVIFGFILSILKGGPFGRI